MLQPIWIEEEKLLCPRCKEEVKEYPPSNMKQGEFVCLNCNSKIRFNINENKYITWINNEF